tara:strand:- start:1774 stop:2454 length:681 start_codon:yes stop_codon:yes gene_type:complete
MKKVVSYYRTSSQANVGDDKDSKKRQEASCDLYAKRNRCSVVNTFYDAGVSGSTSALDRPEFKRMIGWCEDNDVRAILVEDVKRYARDIVMQETTYRTLASMGYEIISATGDVKFDDDIQSTLMRQMVGAFAEYDRKAIALRLKVARQRIRAKKGKCEGRKSLKEIFGEVTFKKIIKKAHDLHDDNMSYAKIADVLAKQGWLQPSKLKPFTKSQVLRLIQQGGKNE